MADKWKLSEALAGKFEVVGTTCPVLHSRIGEVDFRTMDVDQAEALLKAGTSYLKDIRTKKQKLAE